MSQRTAPAGTVTLVERRWRTQLSVVLRGAGARRHVESVRAMLRDEVDLLETLASRFRADSALSAVNAQPGRWVPIPSGLAELLDVALCAAAATDGLVSPCVGHHVDAVGYRAWAQGAPDGVAMTVVPHEPTAPDPDAWQRVEVAAGHARIPAGTQLDLGATAKAWLADELAERVADRTGLDVAANMGGDVRVIGSQGPWVLGVDHGPAGPSLPAVALDSGGLATSGQGRRRWATDRGPAHHIVDPRTGASAVSRWWAVSVAASCATAANTAATTALVLDGAGPAWLERRGLDAILTPLPGTPGAVPRAVGRWPPEQVAA